MWRKAAAALIFAAAALAAYRIVVVPYRCNNIEGRVSRSTDILWAAREDYATRAAAERNLRELNRCIDECRTDVNLRMLAASNLTILGRHDAAAQMLEQSLRYDRRPELHFALGLAEVQVGRRAAALGNFVTAANYGGIHGLREVPDGELRDRAYALAGARLERAMIRSGQLDPRNRVLNPQFSRPGTAAAPAGRGLSASAAAEWVLFTPAGKPVTSALVPSTRRSGGTAIHVVASGADSGLRHVLRGANAPRRALTSAWVFVRRGQVYLGTGSGRTPMSGFSKTTGRWERLEAVNDTCPARIIVIHSATGEGADFLVDEVTARETVAAPPCE